MHYDVNHSDKIVVDITFGSLVTLETEGQVEYIVLSDVLIHTVYSIHTMYTIHVQKNSR